MAIGSIPPDPAINCIRNITFENIWHTFEPYRMLYIKTNPGNVGQGIVDRITVRLVIIRVVFLTPKSDFDRS